MNCSLITGADEQHRVPFFATSHGAVLEAAVSPWKGNQPSGHQFHHYRKPAPERCARRRDGRGTIRSHGKWRGTQRARSDVTSILLLRARSTSVAGTCRTHSEAYQCSLALEEVARALPTNEPVPADEYKAVARDQGFRRAIVLHYDHRCALCGTRIVTSEGHTVVDAAHIIPWSESRNDDIRNEMALCKLCH